MWGAGIEFGIGTQTWASRCTHRAMRLLNPGFVSTAGPLQRLCMVRSRPSAIDDVHRTARGRHPTQVVGESSSWWSSWGRSFCSPCSSVVPAMEASVRTASGEDPAGVCQDFVYGVVATSVFF